MFKSKRNRLQVSFPRGVATPEVAERIHLKNGSTVTLAAAKGALTGSEEPLFVIDDVDSEFEPVEPSLT